MSGHAVAIAAVAAAAIVQAASDRLRCGVIAFAGETMVLRDPRDEVPSERVVEDLLSLRGHGRTDLAGALTRRGRPARARTARRSRGASCCPTACTPRAPIPWPVRGAGRPARSRHEREAGLDRRRQGARPPRARSLAAGHDARRARAQSPGRAALTRRSHGHVLTFRRSCPVGVTRRDFLEALERSRLMRGRTAALIAATVVSTGAVAAAATAAGPRRYRRPPMAIRFSWWHPASIPPPRSRSARARCSKATEASNRRPRRPTVACSC